MKMKLQQHTVTRAQLLAPTSLENCGNNISDALNKTIIMNFFSFILLIHKGHIGRSTRNSNPVNTSSAGSAKGCSDHSFRAPLAYTAQLLTLHQHRANSQYRTANQNLANFKG